MFDRLALLIDNITEAVYVNICRGLFEKDKLLFSFLITSAILRQQGEIDATEWNFFLRGPSVLDASLIPPCPLDWVPLPYARSPVTRGDGEVM